ncbi:hypothetical protein HF072_17470 [Bacillus sp. RO3]|nr:hypothetical protein [Bacillus sp. RO3]
MGVKVWGGWGGFCTWYIQAFLSVPGTPNINPQTVKSQRPKIQSPSSSPIKQKHTKRDPSFWGLAYFG